MSEKQKLAREVIDQHFGIWKNNVSECATCDHVTWPCPPSRLASIVMAEELSR